MITKWKILDPLFDSTTTFRFWCDNEENDLDTAKRLVGKYVDIWGFKTNGLIKIKYDKHNVFYEIITSLPYTLYKENNNFFEFFAVSDKEIQGIKKL